MHTSNTATGRPPILAKMPDPDRPGKINL